MTDLTGQPEFDVFISYRWVTPDQEWVRDDLFPALQAAGLRPLLDVEDFIPGRDLILEMTRAGQSSRRALCVLSPAYFDGNRMAGFEALTARRADPSGLESNLVPVILRKAQLPEWIKGLVPVDWTDPRTHAREWRKLLRVLGASKVDAPPPRSLHGSDGPEVSQTPQSGRPQSTCIRNDAIHIVLTDTGEFEGGQAALRRVSAEVVDGHWGGQIAVHHAYVEGLQRKRQNLHAQDELTADQAKALESLRMQTAVTEASIEAVCVAAQLTFVRMAGREHTWGVPMNTERALGFLTGLFVEGRLTPRNRSADVQCQLYVPNRVNDPISIDVRLSEGDIGDIQKAWVEELRPFDASKWESWDWPTLVPLWRFRDEFIAAQLLPAIALTLAGGVATTAPQTVADLWGRLRHAYPLDKRDPLAPYRWCLALRSDRSSKDLAWLVSPPEARSELWSVLGREK